MQAVSMGDSSVLSSASGADIVLRAGNLGLDPSMLYEAVVDLSSEGHFTANSINMAAGILLNDLGLPRYFFEHITSASLVNLLRSIAKSMEYRDGRVCLCGGVTKVDFNTTFSKASQQVMIATGETREAMESILEEILPGRRRDYYYSDASDYYTYIIRPETVADFSAENFITSRFLFSLDNDFSSMPEPTRRRYERFLHKHEQAEYPLVEVFNLPETGETRLMFNSDFVSPQLPVLRKILDDHDLVLSRAYWEAYLAKSSVPSSICTLYVQGELDREREARVVADLRSFLSFSVSPVLELYLGGELTFHEMLFAGNCIDFCRLFIFQESDNETDREIYENLDFKDHREAFAKRVQAANKSTYGTAIIRDVISSDPKLIKYLYSCFEKKFSPASPERITGEELQAMQRQYEEFITGKFLDFPVGFEILKFMFKIVSGTLKTNFFKPVKRSFSFRFDQSILDPLVYDRFVYGIFFVNGHYGCGTHMRAADIARGGLRLLRVTSSNFDAELDKLVLLNYALGPLAQRLKHKDICESGSKGVIIPYPQYSDMGEEVLLDYVEGIMDLVFTDPSVKDYFSKQEIVFFGPDEGTASLMDAVAHRARSREYPYWRTITTGKSIGVPHDTYGLLKDGSLFGLFSMGGKGVELQVDGSSRMITDDMALIYREIGEEVDICGMTTSSVMSSFRALIGHCREKEEELNLMMTGGPDGDLGANQIQCYKGRICLLIDGGSILFDPAGLDKEELRKIAFQRNSSPRYNSLKYPENKLSSEGFRVSSSGKNIVMPDGSVVEDGALFHRTFLTDVNNRKYIHKANIRAFIPCGGFKDTINQGNVKDFVTLFHELRFIVEGANVFFDSGARRYIGLNTDIKQMKDSTANKGGVYCSSIAEVLTSFLLGDDYESLLLAENNIRQQLVKDVLESLCSYAETETKMLLTLQQQEPSAHFFELSEMTSEKILEMQQLLEKHLSVICDDGDLLWRVLDKYIPQVLCENLGKERILELLGSSDLLPYRNAMVTKKLASLAYYKFYDQWDDFAARIASELLPTLYEIFE